MRTIFNEIKNELYLKTKIDRLKYTNLFITSSNSKWFGKADGENNYIYFNNNQKKFMSDTDIRNILIHEFIHLIDYFIHNTMSGHSKEFKNLVVKLGYDIRIAKSKYRLENKDYNDFSSYKYKVVCKKCGKVVAYRKRKTNLDNYISNCCKSKLEFILND